MKPRKVSTNCIIHQHTRILLGMKKRGFGVGKWNGFGGKVEPGETIEAAAIREVREEAGIEVKNIQKMGVCEFILAGLPEILEVHFFKSDDFEGSPIESDEMAPKWFNVGEIPYELMWADDKYWMPLFLRGQKFKGTFTYDDAGGIIKSELLDA